MRRRLRHLFDRLPPLGALLVAAAAGAAGVAGSYAVAGFTPSFVAGPIAGALARRLPGAVLTAAILFLGDLGELLNVVAATALATGLFAAATLAARAAVRRAGAHPALAPPVAGALVAAAAVAVTGAPAASVAAGAATGAVLAAATLAAGGRDAAGADGNATAPDPASGPGADRRGASEGERSARRGVLGAAASGLGLSVAGYLLGSGGGLGGRGSAQRSDAGDDDAVALDVPESTAAEIGSLLAEARGNSLDVAGIEPLVSEEFYEVDINATDPQVNPETWSLTITGAVEEDVTVGYDEIRAMEPENRFASLRCVGEPLNGEKLDTALWTGVPITDLLPDGLPDECCVMLRAADDYYEEFPLAALSDGFLAYGMNGAPLPRGHGYPVRALIPGHWGEINVKWLTEIEVLEEEAVGYWEERGWHGTGPVETVAKLHAVDERDGRVVVGGHAYAGTRGIDRVEVSTDGGESWTDATLSEPLPGDDVWRQWRHEYDPPGGAHDVVVRAVDGTGEIQPEAESPPFPDGPTGWVSRTVGG